IGAGGGSLAWFDPGGALRVGPQSAGADPGPACYARGGTHPAVTDAHLLAGRLLPHRFLGGKMPLDPRRAERALAELATRKGYSPEELALAILTIANTNMEAALRRVSLERGHDPRRFVLVAFGGAGALHAAELAQRLGIPRVLVPRLSGVLSALGILFAEPRFDFSRGLRPGRDPFSREFLETRLRELEEKARREVRALGFEEEKLEIAAAVDLRYRGQSFEITVPFGPELEETFHREHERLYGFRLPERELEACAVRLRITVKRSLPDLPPFEGGRKLTPVEFTALLLAPHQRCRAPVYLWEEVPVEAEIPGPALIVGDFATVYVPPDFKAACDRFGHLHLYLP
ncbi:hydantoinase/oxoprolinase family protein, partial [Thermosulfurimonas sp.]|uniref:hydantoinase/oxoprolinase family protein n=1 Tax=Thermosulfurimonas sp. TaxID=2080236 RepID=UPI0025ED175A